MGRIIATEFVSLDGVVEAPGGGEEFEYAGWSFEIDRGDEGNKFKVDETFESEALLLGRKTYEGFAAAWPSREGEFADKFNGMHSTSSLQLWARPNGATRRSSAVISRRRWAVCASGTADPSSFTAAPRWCRDSSSMTSSTSSG